MWTTVLNTEVGHVALYLRQTMWLHPSSCRQPFLASILNNISLLFWQIHISCFKSYILIDNCINLHFFCSISLVLSLSFFIWKIISRMFCTEFDRRSQVSLFCDAFPILSWKEGILCCRRPFIRGMQQCQYFCFLNKCIFIRLLGLLTVNKNFIRFLSWEVKRTWTIFALSSVTMCRVTAWPFNLNL